MTAGASDPTGRDDRLEFDIPSDYAHARTVMDAILAAVEKHRFVENAVFGIKLALDEAMINAVKHGNKLDPNKRVQVWVKVSPAVCDITIQDEGPGFNPDAVPDPTLEENLEKSGGRGLLLIRHYMSTADWTDRGRRLHMTRVNHDDARPG
jgi:serine/threonine-protein kinase RsbW